MNNFYINYFFSFLLQNKLISYVIKQLKMLRKDKEYHKLLKQYGELKNSLNLNTKNKKETNAQLKEIGKQLNEKIKLYGLTKASIYQVGSILRKPYSRYISSQMANDICDRVLKSLDKVLYSNGKKLHYKKFDNFNTISAKSLTNGIYFNFDYENPIISFNTSRKRPERHRMLYLFGVKLVDFPICQALFSHIAALLLNFYRYCA